MKDPAHARAAGKTRKQARIVWQLQVGALQLRCLLNAPGTFRKYLVEVKESAGWRRFLFTDDAKKALSFAAASDVARQAITAATERLNEGVL